MCRLQGGFLLGPACDQSFLPLAVLLIEDGKITDRLAAVLARGMFSYPDAFFQLMPLIAQRVRSRKVVPTFCAKQWVDRGKARNIKPR